MAMVSLDLEVTASAGVTAYWIDVDGPPVIPISGGKGTTRITPGDHVLGWHFVGNPGATLAIAGSVNQRPVVKAQGTVPAGDTEGFGTEDFSV